MKLSELNQSMPMFEMANLMPRSTGVGYVMHFGEVGGQHGPRIKVSNTPGKFNTGSNFSLSVSKEPEVMTPPGSVGISQGELNKIVYWMQINYDDLMLLWEIHETGDDIVLPDGQFLSVVEILSRLKKV